MAEVAARDYPFVREVVNREEANRRFADDPLKLERISELGDDETITVYTDGPFTDLCRGPHIPRTGRLKHFKLLSAAGAYWRGDERRQMLQRIYGTAWFKKEELDALPAPPRGGAQTRPPPAGAGARPLRVPPVCAGRAVLYRSRDHDLPVINDYIRELQRRAGYQEIKTPLLYNKGCGRSPGTGGSTARTCSSCSTRRRVSTTSPSSR